MTNQHPEVMPPVGSSPARVALSGGGPAGDAGVGNQPAAIGRIPAMGFRYPACYPEGFLPPRAASESVTRH